jgi:hypothetical protein
MKKSFWTGFLWGISYYILTGIVTWIVYFIAGRQYQHGLGLHHIVSFLFLLGGIVYTLYMLACFVIGYKEKVNLGEFSIHAIMAICGISFQLTVFFSEVKRNQTSELTKKIIIDKQDSLNQSTIIDDTGDTLFLSKEGKIIIDKIARDSVVK